MKMLDIYVASKNALLPNYLFLFMQEYSLQKNLRLAIELTPSTDILILDCETISPGEASKIIKKIPVILYTQRIKPFLLSYTRSFDINGIISLDMEPETVTRTLTSASKRDIYFDEQMISMIFSPKINDIVQRIATITSRENDVLDLMMADFTNEEAAQKLNLSIRTVNAHKGNIKRKMEIKTMSGLVKIMIDYSSRFR